MWLTGSRVRRLERLEIRVERLETQMRCNKGWHEWEVENTMSNGLFIVCKHCYKRAAPTGEQP
jgi:hypothetical protein